MTIAKKVVEKTVIGETGTIGPDSHSEEHLERFHDVVKQFDSLEKQGQLKISYKHKESSTGNKYVDLIKFVRLN